MSSSCSRKAGSSVAARTLSFWPGTRGTGSCTRSMASDPQLMLQVFRQHLKAVSGKAYCIEECIPFRFRCRQSTARCVLQYTLRVVDPSTGRRSEQWVTGLVYAAAGEAERLWREL